MKRSILVLATIVVLVFGCKKDEDIVPSRTIFTFTRQYSSHEDMWIILRDNDTGELIDSKQIDGPGTTVFESTKKIESGKLTVTYFRTNGDSYRYSNVYKDIDIGSTWSIAQIEGAPIRTFAGSYPLTITDVPARNAVVVSDDLSEIAYNFSLQGQSGSNITVSLDVWADIARDRKQLISVAPVGEDPKYLTIENVDANKPVTVSYNSFKNFDQYLRVTLPYAMGVSTHITRYNSSTDQSDYALLLGSSFDVPQISLGFLNSISNYTVEIYSLNWSYVSRGPVPSSIEFVDVAGYQNTISGTTFADYKLSTSKPYLYTDVRFSYIKDHVTYEVIYHSPKGSTKFFEPITPEIAGKYSVDINLLEYDITSFVVKGRSYTDLIQASFDVAYDPATPYEESRLSVQ